MTILDIINGWDSDDGVLQKAVDNCHCNEYGDLSLPEYLFPWFFGPINNPHAASRKKNLGHITKSIDEQSKAFSLSNLVSVFIYTNILFSATGALL